MPQIWLTYAELSDLLKCDASAVRRVVADQKWTRKKSEDGFTRVKLSPMLAHQFMLSYAEKAATNSLTITVPNEIGPGVLGR
jgi:hypothetical protein